MDRQEALDLLFDVITKHERWTFESVASSPHDDAFMADLAQAIDKILGS